MGYYPIYVDIVNMTVLIIVGKFLMFDELQSLNFLKKSHIEYSGVVNVCECVCVWEREREREREREI